MAKKNTVDDKTQTVKDVVAERHSIDKLELFRKERENIPMTYAELEALKREKAKELSNQILRVFGLLTVITIIIFAVGTFLYPYSIFNLFGGGDRFWDCWNKLQFHVGTIMRGEDQLDSNGWINLETLYSVAFQPGISAKCNFIALGAWSIVPLCSIGLIGVLLVSAYLIAYNIRDLISVIKHFVHRTGVVVSDVAISTVESVESAIETNGAKDKKKKPAPKKRKEDDVAQVPEDKKEEDLSLPEIDVDALVEERSTSKEEPKDEKKTEETGGLSSEQLDALLRGESIE